MWRPGSSFFWKVYCSHVFDLHCLVLLSLIWQGCFKVYFKSSEIIITFSFFMPSFLLLLSLAISFISTVHHFRNNWCRLSEKLGLRILWMRLSALAQRGKKRIWGQKISHSGLKRNIGGAQSKSLTQWSQQNLASFARWDARVCLSMVSLVLS